MFRHIALALILAGLAACSDNAAPPAGPDLSRAGHADGQPSIVVCHQPGHATGLIEVSVAALDAHLAHGDYVARLEVDPTRAAAEDGIHFASITGAVAAARAVRTAHGELQSAACRITIAVAAGTFRGSFDANNDPALERFPLMIDVPDITLRGALRMEMDGQERATGQGLPPGEATTLLPDRPIVFLPNTEALIVVVGHPGGPQGNGAVIEGFAFQSGRTDASSGGMGIIALRVRDLLIRGNRFEPGLSSAADLRATSARLDLNYGFRLGVNCAICLAGPGDYEASGNRLVEGGLGGIYVSAVIQHMDFSLGASPAAPVEPYVLPASATVSAAIVNNDIRNHLRLPIGFAVRVLAVGPGSSQMQQSSRVYLGGNDLTGNTFGLILDAGFPVAGTLRRGDLDVTLHGNTVSGSCQNNLLVAFTRHTGALGTTTNPYLLNSTYRVDLGGDLPWEEAWYSNPAGLGNTLLVGGTTIAPGAHVAYDPIRHCP